MAAGELVHQTEPGEQEFGVGVYPTGRVSVAKMYEPAKPTSPFSVQQLARLDEALTLSSRETGLDFSVYLGELGSDTADTRVGAEKLHSSIGEHAANAVLVAVSPGQRVVEVVTGATALQRVPDRAAKLAVSSMVASFKEGDLVGGLVSGLRMLSDYAGRAPA